MIIFSEKSLLFPHHLIIHMVKIILETFLLRKHKILKWTYLLKRKLWFRVLTFQLRPIASVPQLENNYQQLPLIGFSIKESGRYTVRSFWDMAGYSAQCNNRYLLKIVFWQANVDSWQNKNSFSCRSNFLTAFVHSILDSICFNYLM